MGWMTVRSASSRSTFSVPRVTENASPAASSISGLVSNPRACMNSPRLDDDTYAPKPSAQYDPMTAVLPAKSGCSSRAAANASSTSASSCSPSSLRPSAAAIIVTWSSMGVR